MTSGAVSNFQIPKINLKSDILVIFSRLHFAATWSIVTTGILERKVERAN
jgi:hypothetical protein